MKADTRKLDSTEELLEGLEVDVQGAGGFGPGRKISLKSFADRRRAYLLSYKPDPK
ncbi:MAG: hypothetical protein HY721_05260 [Planctomycetes bacterium]|nr:hypothetical protein [Planctomycetota bacterium]